MEWSNLLYSRHKIASQLCWGKYVWLLQAQQNPIAVRPRLPVPKSVFFKKRLAKQLDQYWSSSMDRCVFYNRCCVIQYNDSEENLTRRIPKITFHLLETNENPKYGWGRVARHSQQHKTTHMLTQANINKQPLRIYTTKTRSTTVMERDTQNTTTASYFHKKSLRNQWLKNTSTSLTYAEENMRIPSRDPN